MLLSLTAASYLLQPVARLWVRFRFGLTPWRRRHGLAAVFPCTRAGKIWSEQWRAPEEWPERFERAVLRYTSAGRGGDFDNWDFFVRGGLAAGAYVYLGIEEHGQGKQLLRWRIRPAPNLFAVCVAFGLLALAAMAGRSGQTVVAASLCAFGAVVAM